ncbi:hypothetical protein NKR19_g5504 [Coniochaeta hoffmannii]|uniref:HTH CENPB-type domain-containing protein n=1 Tax=Coniochaeta hoffmannii TaxID=91930 RepID=A0AA38VSS0_9PEZI|nr:hypothetical protein NKR19_g5504 [Coniochaeta hoffmannii]
MAPPQPSPSTSHSAPHPQSSKPPQPNRPVYPPEAGLLAARALVNHNRRVEGLSRSSAPKRRMSIRDAAAKWNASKTTVARHVRALLETDRPHRSDNPPGRPRALTRTEEDALAAFCVYLARGNCMGNIPLVHRAANELRARRTPPMGPCHRRWVCRWLMEREDLTLRNIPRADRQYRIEGGEEVVVKGFFDQYFKEKIESDRRAVEARLAANGEERRGGREGPPNGDHGAVEDTQQHMPVDPRLVGPEQGGSQMEAG